MKTRSDKVAVVTGSGKGIGKAIATRLLREGISVVLNGRDPDRLRRTKSELEKINPSVDFYCGDITDPQEALQLIDFTIQRFGRLDILVNNVGVSNRGAIASSLPEVFKRVFESNVYVSVNTTVAAMMHLRKNKGSVVFISSVAGIHGLPGLGAYSASKRALRSIAESLRIEEHTSGIHVGLIQVGITEIESGKVAIGHDGKGVILADRSGRGVHSTAYVAAKVWTNIHRRKFITTLGTAGKLNALMHALFPSLVEKIVIRFHRKFEEKSH